MRELISRLNWKQIVFYIIATLLLVIGWKQFSFLTDIELTERIVDHVPVRDVENGAKRWVHLLTWIGVSRMVALAISGLIMFQLTRKIKYSWINMVIVLLLGYVITRLELFHSDLIKKVTLFPGGLLSKAGPFYPYLVNGLFLTGLALLIFYNKWTNKFTRIHQTQFPATSK